MKRSVPIENLVGEQQEKAKSFRRQNPVSCLFCRTKKLRCDRAQPCSNCVARNVRCVPSSEPAETPALTPSSFHSQCDLSVIEKRLKVLEQAVFQKPIVQDQQQSREALEDQTISKTAVWIETTAGAINDPADTRNFYDDNTPYYGDITSRDGMHDASSASTRQHHPLGLSDIAFMLPPKAIAESALENYVTHLNWMSNIIHVPTVRQQLASIYMSLEAQHRPRLPDVALIATILAVMAYFRSGSPQATDKDESLSASKKWSLLATKALSDANHATSPKIETIQATIIMTQYLPNYGQPSLCTAAIVHSAHIIQLHKVDSTKNCKMREETVSNAIELEVKRRIWWHIASSDWLLSFMSGAQSGTYVCHPDQMNVLIPSNLDDDELTATEAPNHPISEATEMTYCISRIHLSSLIRELVDKACKQGLEVDELPYEQVLAFDKKLGAAFDALPWFYKLDDINVRRADALGEKRPHIVWQRFFIHFGYHTRLCQLHRPYLARGYKDPRYAYSRMICLRSARMVIELESKMTQLRGGLNPQAGRHWIIIHHVFVATVTLVMDYVCHRDDPQAAERKQEIVNCYKVLERSQEDSGIARRGLGQLKQIMKDWMLKSDAKAAKFVAAADSSRPNNPAKETTKAPAPDMQAESTNAFLDNHVDRVSESMAYDTNTNWMGFEVAQDIWFDPLDFNSMQDDPQWEELFRGLENQPSWYG